MSRNHLVKAIPRLLLALWLAIGPAWAGSMTLLGVGKTGAVAATTTWDPIAHGPAISLSPDKLTATLTGGDGNVLAIAGHSTGKFFHSITIGPNYALNSIGIANSSESLTSGFLGQGFNSLGLFGSGGVFINNSNFASVGFTFTSGDVVDLAFDLGGKLFWARKNGGNWNNNVTNDPATGVGGISISSLNAGPYFPAGGLDDTGGSMAANFGPTYSSAAPSSYLNW